MGGEVPAWVERVGCSNEQSEIKRQCLNLDQIKENAVKRSISLGIDRWHDGKAFTVRDPNITLSRLRDVVTDQK